MSNHRGAAVIAGLVAAAASVGMWWGICRFTGEVEAWDSLYYFVAGVPLLCAVLVVLGYLSPHSAWRTAVVAGIGQVAAMFWLQRKSGPLLVLGLAFHAAITFGLFGMAAQAGATFARRRQHGSAG